MPVQLYKDQKRVYTHISEDVKFKNKKADRYSIFGPHHAFMDFAYVPISNVERNNKGLYSASYKDSSYYNEGIYKRTPHNPIDVPVWLLPFTIMDPPQEKTVFTQPAEQTIEDLAIVEKKPKEQPTTSFYKKTFQWPYGGNHVVLTGDFDNWTGSIEMSPVTNSSNDKPVFTATVTHLDGTKDLEYKFIVDGQWCFDIKAETIQDEAGNINNILYARK